MNPDQVNRADHRQHELGMAKLRDTAAVLTNKIKRYQKMERATRKALIEATAKAERAIENWTEAGQALIASYSDAEAHNSAVLDRHPDNPLLQSIYPGARPIVRIDQGLVDTITKGCASMALKWRQEARHPESDVPPDR